MKTSELIGAQLDWAVAKCEGSAPAITTVHEQADRFRSAVHFDGSKPPQENIDAVIARLKLRIYCNEDRITLIPEYSTDWAQGGPIIGREKISIRQWLTPPIVHAYMPIDGAQWSSDGDSPLIAAMRCYVASKLGDTVYIPEELC